MQETEEQFLEKVAEAARLWGWRRVHFRRARAPITKRNKSGWATPVEFDSKGFPDLVLVRGRVIFAELKSEKGKLTPEQIEWIDTLRNAGAEIYVWRPSQWEDVESILRD